MPPRSDAVEVLVLGGIVLSAILTMFLLPIAWTWAAARLSDRRIRLLSLRIRQFEEQEDWAAASQNVAKVVRLLRRRRPTPDIRARLADALHSHACLRGILGHDDDELRLLREAYRWAESVDGLPPHELAGLAFQLGLVMCAHDRDAEAIVYTEAALAEADPESELAVRAGMQGSVALRRAGLKGRALKLARETVQLAEALAMPPTVIAMARLTLTTALPTEEPSGQADDEILLAHASYLTGRAASAVVPRQRHALRAKQIFEGLEQRDPGRYAHQLAEVARLLKPA